MDSLQELEMLHGDIDRAFEEFGLESAPFSRSGFLPGLLARGYPLVNLHEDKDDVYVEALAPGSIPNR